MSQKFFYDFNNTPVITKISKIKLSVLGGEIVTINGFNLPIQLSEVLIGSGSAKILSNNSSRIIIETPSNNPGVYDLIIPSGTLGNVL